MPVVAAMRDFAYAANVLGLNHETDLFPAAQRSGIDGAITTLCQTPFGGSLQGTALHLGDLFDPTLSASFVACVDGGAGCGSAGSDLYAYLQHDLVAPDPAGPPILYVQGLADVIMPPQSEAACNIQLLEQTGVDVQVCVDGPALHTDITARDGALGVAWGEAKLDGAPLPSCDSSGLPACVP
jgi:hypothetical protein